MGSLLSNLVHGGGLLLLLRLALLLPVQLRALLLVQMLGMPIAFKCVPFVVARAGIAALVPRTVIDAAD